MDHVAHGRKVFPNGNTQRCVPIYLTIGTLNSIFSERERVNMNLKQKNQMLESVRALSNEELESLYYKSLYDCLGSDIEEMIELDYSLRDIEERRKYEKYLCEKCSLLGSVCIERGIELFKE